MIKKILSIILLPMILLISSCQNIEKFNVETQEGIKEPITINKDDYDEMIDEKKSFVLYISSSTCSSCREFNDKLNPFIEETSIVIYKIESYLVSEEINYYATPAIAMIKDGEISNLINAADNGKYFKSTKNIKNYILRYVEI